MKKILISFSWKYINPIEMLVTDVFWVFTYYHHADTKKNLKTNNYNIVPESDFRIGNFHR